MSVRLHLSLEDLLDAGHTIVETSKQHGYNSIMLGRLRVNVNEAMTAAFVDLGSNDLGEIELSPDLDRKLIQSITSHHLFHMDAIRRLGEYRYRSVSATLEKVTIGKGYMYQLHLSGTDLEEMKVLYRDIRQGCIWPVVDYEAPMVPPPCRHLRQLVREAWAIIRRDTILRLRRA